MPPKNKNYPRVARSNKRPKPVDEGSDTDGEEVTEVPQPATTKARRTPPTSLEKVSAQTNALATLQNASSASASNTRSGTSSDIVFKSVVSALAMTSSNFSEEAYTLERLGCSKDVIDRYVNSHIDNKEKLVNQLVRVTGSEVELKEKNFNTVKKYVDDTMANKKASTQEKQIAVGLLNNATVGVSSNLTTMGGKTGPMTLTAASAPSNMGPPPRKSFCLDDYFGDSTQSITSQGPSIEEVPTPLHRETESEEQ